MAKILRLQDRIKLSIGEIVFTLAPLNKLQKQELSECTKNVDGKEIINLTQAQHLWMKYSIKDVDGLRTYSDEPYKLEFDGDVLTDDCVTELFNLEEKETLTNVAWQILNGISELKDLNTGEKLEGVELEVVPKKY